ncbi:hypothetical protein EWM64_g1137 [Hericium alpestre]|uniref:BZIP domain-containing protein n=1 Tax=Hericium alpestre TaxID=135208 RepID=A0A4Z0A9A6_9AGAM|nr:hypothetical protein EWM64_g1137 [Hericium alpestre]
MSSKRGRKRNDSLPPNRARDVQRAFRARRAAHLEALEQRVAELEEENNTLRAALNLPPANRPALGKGPTGKDKPKAYNAGSSSRTHSSGDAPPGVSSTSRDGSSAGESPSSTRTHSMSPSTITAAMRPSPHSVHSLEGASWDQPMLIPDEQPEQQASPPSSGYSLSAVAAHKPQPHYSYPSPVPSTSRSVPTPMYIPPVSQSAQNYAHTADRPMGDGYATSYPLRDIREETPHFAYSQNPFTSHDGTHLHHPTPTTTSIHPQPIHRDTSSTQPSLHYVPRRSVHEQPPQNYRPPMLNPYHLPPPHPQLRRPSSPHLDSHSIHLRPPYDDGGE